MWAEIGLKNTEKVEYEGILEKVTELKTKRDEISTKYNNIPRESIEMLDKIIPSKPDGVSLVNDINLMASRYGMSIKEFKTDVSKPASRDAPNTEVEAEKYKTAITTFRLSGQYGEFLKFLKDLELSLHLVDVTGLFMRSSQGVKLGDTALEYSLSIQTYSLK